MDGWMDDGRLMDGWKDGIMDGDEGRKDGGRGTYIL